MSLRVFSGYLLLSVGLSGCGSRGQPESTHAAFVATAAIESLAAPTLSAVEPTATLGGKGCPWDTVTDGRDRAAENRSAEVPRLASTAGRIVRHGDTLMERLAGSREERLIDCLFSADRFARYSYLSEGPKGLGLLFEIGQYESNNPFWMDDSSGVTTPLASLPVYSPDSAYFAVANEDLMAGYTANVFEVWRVGGRALERVFRAEGKDDWGASGVVWRTRGVVQFTRSRLVGDEIVPDSEPVLVELREGRWQYNIRSP